MKYTIPDRVISDIVFAAKKCGIQKIILFGSRARGTNQERSDIDLAVSGGDFDRFYWELQENVHTLLAFDLVALDRGVSAELKAELCADGVVIYEKI